MLSAHHNRNNSEAVPLRNSREDIVIANNSTNTHTSSTSPVSVGILPADSGGLSVGIKMGDDTQRILLKIVIDLVLIACGK